MKNFAHLKPESPWYPLFDGGRVPIRNILLPRVGKMIGDGVQEFYDVDVTKLSEEQIDQICFMVAKQCGGARLEIRRHMLAEGFIPLRAKHVSSTSSDAPFFI